MRNKNKDWKKRWKEVVKNDRDWDYEYLDTIVGHKLELMLEFFNSDDCMQADESRLPIVAELQEVVDLYHKIKDYQYSKAASDFFAQHCKPLKDEILCVEWDDIKNKEIWLKMEDEAWEEEKQDRQKFYSLIGKYELEWWD